MSQIYTFGVEIEALYTYVHADAIEGLLNANTGKSIVLHTLTDAEKKIWDRGDINPNLNRVISHIRQSMIDAGFPVALNSNKMHLDITKWDVKTDGSIGQTGFPEPGRIKQQAGVEIVSPAMIFSQDSLDEVLRLCDHLNKIFEVVTNATCGIHIHVGHHLQGKKGYTLSNLKKLSSLLYTFEPQISSLHPSARLEEFYAIQMRHGSTFTKNFQEKHDRLPRPSEYTQHVFECQDRASWWANTKNFGTAKASAYNMVGVHIDVPAEGEDQRQRMNLTQTIEFRQHAGSTDGIAITHWIQTVIGIIKYAEEGVPVHFYELLTSAWKAEKWEKMGMYNKISDADRTIAMGTPLEDEGFTVIDLLMAIGLKKQAKYYSDKRFVHKISGARKEL